ncbi:unnamed protein product [Gadus morhua 'NCC']
MVLDVSQNIGSLRFPCGQTYRNEFPGFSGPGGRGSSVMRGQHAPRRRLIAHRLVLQLPPTDTFCFQAETSPVPLTAPVDGLILWLSGIRV